MARGKTEELILSRMQRTGVYSFNRGLMRRSDGRYAKLYETGVREWNAAQKLIAAGLVTVEYNRQHYDGEMYTEVTLRLTRRQNGHEQFGERNAGPKRRNRALATNAEGRFKSAHWGLAPTKTYRYPKQKHTPKKIPGMGKLEEIRINPGNGDPEIILDHFGPNDILAFATTEDERLYAALCQATKKKNRRLFPKDNGDWYQLDELADEAGGRQTAFAHAPVFVQNVGVITDVVYRTKKKEDAEQDNGEPSSYIHALGEETGIKPLLGIDAEGGLWFAGGDYTVPDEGITN
jgi:hypothetical protein